jgi:osmotically-inducible protein OsmY
MFRALLRLIVVLVVLVGAAGFFLGWWGNNHLYPASRTAPAVGTAGHVDAEKAREAGAAVGEKTAEAANRASQILADGALTAKIKSKMALDDLVQARSIDVSTTNHIVTLRGTVRSVAEHDRAVQLAKETAGVTQVIDKLAVRG